MSLVFQVLAFLASLYIVVLLGRIVLDWIHYFARRWRPRGAVLVLANVIYGLTDAPLRLLRRWIKPVSFGQFSLDLAFLVLFVAAWFAQVLLYRAAWLLS
ncbi:MAG TPA: YggT family protein [Actinomycetaceae bacterium]|nr:YggT family protein [Actinomycetaceae bacterium]